MNAYPDFNSAVVAATSELASVSLLASVTVLFVSVSGLTMQLTIARSGEIVNVEPVS